MTSFWEYFWTCFITVCSNIITNIIQFWINKWTKNEEEEEWKRKLAEKEEEWKRKLAEKEEEWKRKLAEKEEEWKRKLAEKEEEWKRKLAEKEEEWKKKLAEKEEEWKRKLAEKEEEWKKKLAEKEEEKIQIPPPKLKMDEFDEFSLITKLDQQKLTHLLISIPGNKELIVETQLLRPLDKICSMSTLRSNNCIRVQQFYMDKQILWDENAEERIFLIRPTIEISRKICELIRSNPQRHYSIIQVGGSKNFFAREIEKNALHGLVDLYEFNLTLIHLESDLFSMELPQYSLNTFSNYFDPLVRALWQLQILYGEIQTIYCLGECSTYIHKLYKRLCINLTEPKATPDQPISHLFIFDRRLDIPSTLLTGLTYESILNDVFKYNCGKITFGPAVDEKLAQRQNSNNSNKSQNQPKIYSLNNLDPIFSSIRNSHMTSVFPFLTTKAKFIQSSFDRVSSIKKVDEMKSFVSKELANLREERRQLEIHICACEYILEKIGGTNERFVIEHDIIRGQFQDSDVFAFLQKMIATKTNPWSILQLASLWSLRKNGISPKLMQQFQELFLHRYGFKFMSALYGLRINGLFFENGLLNLIPPPITNALKANFGKQKLSNESKRNEGNRFSQIATLTIDGFQLCSADQNKKKNEMEKSTEIENGLGFVFSDAYIPLITSIVNRTVTKGWDEGHLKNILGHRTVFASDPNAKAPDNRIRRAIVVCFVGGVTYAEIASLRCFSQQRDFRLIILTTHLINREEFLKNFAKIL